MMLLAVGCNFRTTPLELRERLAFAEHRLPAALAELCARYDCEALILSTCNRVELYLARLAVPQELDVGLVTEFLGEFHGLAPAQVQPHLYAHRNEAVVRHLFRVIASLDSLIVGEGQIAGQVKRAYELAQQHASAGPVLHALFQHARLVAKRVRSETGIARGRVSISSAAVDCARQVFSRFDDKTVVVIGAGKMGEVTLRHLKQLTPKRIIVTNRSSEKAEAVAKGCGGYTVPWEQLDDALVRADIILSTTGAPEPIVTRQRWDKVLAKRNKEMAVIFDIAVPRDFDAAIHDGETAVLYNIDDLKAIGEATLQDRLRHIAPAEAIVEHEQKRFLKEWGRRRNGPIIAQLVQSSETKRQALLQPLLQRHNGRLPDDIRADFDGMTKLLVNQLLHAPISALSEEGHEAGRHTLLEALRKLFRLEE
jgi:glutamyl-tRNA reductase